MEGARCETRRDAARGRERAEDALPGETKTEKRALAFSSKNMKNVR